jgi:hypothetical protein
MELPIKKILKDMCDRLQHATTAALSDGEIWNELLAVEETIGAAKAIEAMGRPEKIMPVAAASAFKAAMQKIVPDDQARRNKFEAVMPYIFILRNKGCSFPQITQLLNNASFNLQPSQVRIYYSEMLATRMDICQERMNEQILMMTEIRKETKGAVSPSRTAIKKAGVRPAPDGQGGSTSRGNEGTVSRDNFGLLNVKPSEQKNRPSPGFFDMDDAPAVPDLTVKAAPVSSRVETPPTTPIEPLRCMPLREGIKPIKKRDNVPPALYLPGNMEHPCIPGLMLNPEERVYGTSLELSNLDTGEIRLETMEEKRFRCRWTVPIPPTIVESGKNFIKMDMSLFPGPGGGKRS